MKKSRFSLNFKDDTLFALIQETDQRTLAAWAIDCVARLLPYYEMHFPHDNRPLAALDTQQAWIDTGEFSMKIIRGTALAAHAAAREVGADTPARSTARAAGQAVATAHVAAHALAAANYALQAVHRAHLEGKPDRAVAEERAWQHHQLLSLKTGLLGAANPDHTQPSIKD